MKELNTLLNAPRAGTVLLSLHLVMLLASFFAFGNEISGDQATYLGLARGLEQGVFSYWTGVFDPPPIETYRTHGYPAFLVLVRWISHQLITIKVEQALLHVLGLFLVSGWLHRQVNGDRKRNLFLLLLLPQFQIIYYVHQVFPEALMGVICTTAVVLGWEQRPGTWRTIFLGVVLAAGFWVRPVFLLFPALVIVADLVFAKNVERGPVLRRNLLTSAIFLLTGPLPFGIWNLNTHGHFKPVPLSGSAVVTNLGFWQLRLPGYGSMHYFHYNYFGNEFISWVTADEAEKYYATYQAQWARIDSMTRPAMTADDARFLPEMTAKYDSLFITRSPQYTMALDKAIRSETLRSIKTEPGYYLASRIYTTVRLWVTNINYPMQRLIYRPGTKERPITGRPSGLGGWAKATVPFLITAFTFGIGLTLIIRSVWMGRERWRERRYALYLIGYLWMIHIPMVMQSRYLVPIHMITIACIALALADRTNKTSEVHQGECGT